MITKIAQVHPGRQLAAEQFLGRLREQDLAAVAGRADPRRPVHIKAGIVLPDHDRLACVDPYPNPNHCSFRPGVLGQSLLSGHGRHHRLAGLVEGTKKTSPSVPPPGRQTG
jgi:hypothetical protein